MESKKKCCLFLIRFPEKHRLKSKLFEIIDVFVKGGYEVIVHRRRQSEMVSKKTKELAPQVDLVVCSGATEHWMKLSAV